MRVLVTRPEADGRRTASHLAARGHEAILAPLTAILPVADPPPGGPWDAILLTSSNAVPALAPVAPRCPVFAVGARTAAAAREAGCGDVREARGDALSLAALVRATLPAGATLLHAAGRDRKEEPERSLRASGFEVRVWETYDARPVATLPDGLCEALRAGRIDAALHFSRRSAGLLVGLVEAAGLLRPFRTLSHLCLSADVAAALDGSAVRIAVAAAPREEALLDLVDRLAGEAGSRLPFA